MGVTAPVFKVLSAPVPNLADAGLEVPDSEDEFDGWGDEEELPAALSQFPGSESNPPALPLGPNSDEERQAEDEDQDMSSEEHEGQGAAEASALP